MLDNGFKHAQQMHDQQEPPDYENDQCDICQQDEDVCDDCNDADKFQEYGSYEKWIKLGEKMYGKKLTVVKPIQKEVFVRNRNYELIETNKDGWIFRDKYLADKINAEMEKIINHKEE